MVTIKIWASKSAVFLLALAMMITGCTPKGPRALLDGKKLVEQGRYPEAVEKLELATSLMGTNAAAWNYLGVAYHHNQQATNAEQAYSRALALDRNLAEAYYNLGCLRLENQRLDPARAALITYTSLRGNSLEGWLRLASAQLKLRELPAAEKSFNEALRLDHENAEALNGLGMIQVQRRDPREAARLFNSALKTQPDYAPALLNLAIVNHNYLNNRSLALQKYHEYLALPARPENWEAVNATAQALDQELNPRPAMTQAPVPQPTTPRPQPNPALTVPKPTNNPVARNTTPPKPEAVPTNAPRPAINTSSSPPGDIVKLPPEQTIKPAQDPSAAPRAAGTNTLHVAGSASAKADSNKTNKPGFLRQLNPMNLFRHDSTNSRTASTTPLPKLPETSSPPVLERTSETSAVFPRYNYRKPARPEAGDSAAAERSFQQGLRAHQAGRLAEAIKAYTEATQSDPAYFDAFYNLGLAAAANGNLSQALTAYETALAIRPESSDARYNFAMALKQGNYIPDAVRELETVLAKNPNEARAQVILGNLYAQQLHQPAKARVHYLQALELDPHNPQAPAIRFWLSSH